MSDTMVTHLDRIAKAVSRLDDHLLEDALTENLYKRLCHYRELIEREILHARNHLSALAEEKLKEEGE